VPCPSTTGTKLSVVPVPPPEITSSMTPQENITLATSVSDEGVQGDESDVETDTEELVGGCDDCYPCAYFSGGSGDIDCKVNVYDCRKCHLTVCSNCVSHGCHKRHKKYMTVVDT
jgi:hypothetical protein